MSGTSFPALKPVLNRAYFLLVRLYSLPEDNVEQVYIFENIIDHCTNLDFKKVALSHVWIFIKHHMVSENHQLNRKVQEKEIGRRS